MSEKRERRNLPIAELRVHKGDDGAQKITGHAAVFDTLSEDLGFFREKIAPGAFTPSIAEDDVRALWNHDPNFVLGRNRAGTLRMKEDDKGLAIAVDLPDTQAARDLTVSIERGDVSQMSFGFRTLVEEWDESDPQNIIRTLKKVTLFDVSPVTYPAYPDTDVDVAQRSYDVWRDEQKIASRPKLARAKAQMVGVRL